MRCLNVTVGVSASPSLGPHTMNSLMLIDSTWGLKSYMPLDLALLTSCVAPGSDLPSLSPCSVTCDIGVVTPAQEPKLRAPPPPS